MSTTSQELLDELRRQFKGRKFSAGLLVAFIDLLRALAVFDDPAVNTYEQLLVKYERQTSIKGGRPANTLILNVGEGQSLSLRSFYDRVETFFRSDQKRFDYPSCAPHATQAWPDYVPWINALCGLSIEDASHLRAEVVEFVLAELPSQAFDPGSVVREPPLFRILLEEFDFERQHKGELTGAAYQGFVFGFIRADNPHLQVEIDKVRTGSKRLQRIGDIDAWEGERLALSAEVKQYVVGAEDLSQLAAFENATDQRGAIGIVAALRFTSEAQQRLSEGGLNAISKADLLRIVRLWDPMKQRTALASLLYYVKHVEKSSALGKRLDAHIEQIRSSFAGPGDGGEN